MAWGVLGSRAKAGVADLVKLLGNRDPQLRQRAAHALGAIGPEAFKAVPALKKALKDSDPTVRQAADVALQRIRGK
jgi:HEAT repeat protein